MFALRTRRFGKVAEILIERLTGAGRARNIFHDLFDDIRDERIEVKFATVSAKHESPITRDNLFEAVASAADARAVLFSEWRSTKFDCNIQQVKPVEFDVLFYGLFFHDRVSIFRITPAEIEADTLIRYCDRQHKGNIGEGQFHLNQNTLPHHLTHYHVRDLSYSEFMTLFMEP